MAQSTEAREVSLALSQLADQQEQKHAIGIRNEQVAEKNFQALDLSLAKKIEVQQAALEMKRGHLVASQESLVEKTHTLSHKKEVTQATSVYMSSVVGQCQRRERVLKEKASLRSVVFLSLSTAQRMLGSSSSAAQSPAPSQQSLTAVPVAPSVSSATSSAAPADLFSLDSPAVSFAQVAQVENGDGQWKMRATLQNMIVKLLDESTSEDGHQKWCADETGKSRKLEGEYGEAMKQLRSRIAQGEEECTNVHSELANLRLQAQDLRQLLQQAANLQSAEHSQISRASSEYQDAQALMQNAATVLQGLSNAGSGQRGAPSFLSRQPLVRTVGLPELSDQILRPKFASQLQSPSGIVAHAVDNSARTLSLLNVAMSGFAKLEARGRLEDQEAQKEYAKLLADTNTRTDMTAKEEQYSRDALDKTEHDLERMKSDLQGSETELAAVQGYLEQLKSSCAAAQSFQKTENDSQHREEQIQSLQTALRRLNVQV